MNDYIFISDKERENYYKLSMQEKRRIALLQFTKLSAKIDEKLTYKDLIIKCSVEIAAKCLIELKNRINKNTVSLNNPFVEMYLPVEIDNDLIPIENIELLIKDYEIATIDSLNNSIPNWIEYIGYYEALKYFSAHKLIIEDVITKKINFKAEYLPLLIDNNKKACYKVIISLLFENDSININAIDEHLNNYLLKRKIISENEILTFIANGLPYNEVFAKSGYTKGSFKNIMTLIYNTPIYKGIELKIIPETARNKYANLQKQLGDLIKSYQKPYLL